MIFYFQTGEFVSDDVVAQAQQALKNLGAVLRAAGTTEQNGKYRCGILYLVALTLGFVRSDQDNCSPCRY